MDSFRSAQWVCRVRVLVEIQCTQRRSHEAREENTEVAC